MRGRIVSYSLCASSWLLGAGVFVGLLEAPAHALNPRVKIYNGSQLAAPAMSQGATRSLSRDDLEPAAQFDASRQPLRQPGRRASATKPLAEPGSFTSFGSQQPLADEASWGEDNSGTADEASLDSAGGDSYGGESFGAASGGCDACGDDSCQGDCAGCYAPFGLSAGVEATYLKPGYDDSSGLDAPNTFGYQAAPRLWIGWQNRAGWGIRGRYWDFDADQQRAAIVDFDDLAGAQNFDDDLHVYAVDLELTRSFTLGSILGCASFGARQGRFNRQIQQQVTLFDIEGGGSDDASVIQQNIERDLNGTGLTAALGFRRPLFDSRFSAICNLRGSVLWGGNDLRYDLNVIEAVPVGAGDLDINDFQQITAFGTNGSGMWIGEVQAGGEWNTPLSNSVGAGNAFIRVMFEGQWWNLPGVDTDNEDFGTGSQLYDFLGVTAAVGFVR